MTISGQSDGEEAATFRHAFAETSVKAFVVEAMLPLWQVGSQRGEPKYQISALYPLLNPDVSFNWPWFDKWRTRFAAGEMPDTWIYLASRIKDKRLGLREDKVNMMANVIGSLLLNRRSAWQHVNTPGLRPVYTVHSQCAVSAAIAKEFSDTLQPGNWRTYPPYFPGDTSWVTRSIGR